MVNDPFYIVEKVYNVLFPAYPISLIREVTYLAMVQLFIDFVLGNRLSRFFRFLSLTIKFISIPFMVLSTTGVIADSPPDPGGGPGSGDLPVGGGAPLSGELVFFAVIASIYLINRYRKQIQKQIFSFIRI